MAEKKWSEMARIIDPTDDTELCILDGNPLMNKRIKKVDFLKDSLSLALKTQNYIIDTEDFFPPNTSQFPFLITPGSYGVVFNNPPIVGVDEINFNLRVDYVSHDGSGEDGDQDIIQTLTTGDGLSYTRKLYHVFHQANMSATDFKTVGSGSGSGSEGSSAVNVLKSETHMIDIGDFFPPATNMFPFFKTPGSYGVVFNDLPIVGINETNFNLKVDYVSHHGSGGDGDQDILQTLTTKDGVSYTRRLYHVGQQADMSATDFKTTEVTSGSGSSWNSTLSATAPLNPKEGDKWITESCEFTFLNNNWIEL